MPIGVQMSTIEDVAGEEDDPPNFREAQVLPEIKIRRGRPKKILTGRKGRPRKQPPMVPIQQDPEEEGHEEA